MQQFDILFMTEALFCQLFYDLASQRTFGSTIHTWAKELEEKSFMATWSLPVPQKSADDTS